MDNRHRSSATAGAAGRRLVPYLIVLVAFGTRVVALGSVPPGLTHDESAHLHDAQRIWEGYRPIYLTSAYGREPLYDYVLAPLVGLAGMGVVTGRLASALWGTTLVALLYAWSWRALGWLAAVLAAALLALSFWPLSTSRQILRSAAMPTLLVAALLLFWRAVYPPAGCKDRRYFALAGGVLGLSFYAYMPARVTWFIPVLFALALALVDRPRWRRIRSGLLLMLVTMGLVAAPLLVYLARHPGLEARVAELAVPVQAFVAGDPGPLWDRVQETMLLFSHRGDIHWMYNLSGKPLLPPVLAALFYVGSLFAVYGALRWRRPAYALLVLWLLLGLSPALVTGLESSALRAIAAQPAVFVIAALPLASTFDWLWHGAGWHNRREVVGRATGPGRAKSDVLRLARAAGIGLMVLAFAGLGMKTAHDYFNVWAQHRDTRVAYNAAIAEMARYLKTHPADTPTLVSSLYPSRFHDPSLIDALVGEPGPDTRWYNAQHALVLPDADQAQAVFPALVALDPALQPLFQPAARLVDRVELAPNDLSPWFEVYTWQPRLARAALSLRNPIDVGHVVAFVGYQLNTPSVSPGATVELLTFWRVLDPRANAGLEPDEDLVLFSHVVNTGGQIVGQEDRLDVPHWNWIPGDVFVQLHRFNLQTGLAPGSYPLKIGMYWRAPHYPRLPVYDPPDAEVVADHISLSPIEVLAP